MDWKPKPRNKNITVRITAEEKREFKEIANKNHVSESNWAHQILKKHKYSYGKTENIDQLLGGIEIILESHDLVLEVLKSQIKKSLDTLSPEHTDIIILKRKIGLNYQKISKLKKIIMDSKLG